MKRLKRWICILLGLALIFTMSTATTFAASKPAKVTNLKVKSTTYNSIKIGWKKVSGATGYQVYRSASKSGTFKLVKTINKGKTVTFKDNKLKSNKTYFYKVRAVKKGSKGKFSAVISGKTKKCLSVSKKSITLNSGQSKTITVTYKQPGYVYWNSDNTDIATCSWGDFDGDKGPLTIEAGEPGTTSIYITNDHNKETIELKVTVKGANGEDYSNGHIEVKMIIPQKNTYNYYVGIEVVNYSDEPILVSNFAAAGIKGVTSFVDKIIIEPGYGSTINFYRALLPEEIYDDDNCDMYLDETSTGYIYIANADDTSGRKRVDFTGDGSYTKYYIPW